MTRPREAAPPDRRGRSLPAPGTWVPYGLVLLSVLFGLVLLYGDYRLAEVESNDRLLHELLTRYATEHWNEHWPVDHWFPGIGAGFAVFGHYPHLSHLVTAALSRVLPGVEPGGLYAALAYLLLALMPVSIFVSLRRMGMSRWSAALAAALFPLLRARPFFGIGWESYVHRGSGLLPQLWGVFLFFPALGWGYRALRDGSRVVAGLLIAACLVSHSVYGYVVAISLAVLVLVPDPLVSWRRRVPRLAAVGVVAFVASAYYTIPLAIYASEALRSQWEPAWKWDSIGLTEVLRGLVRGDIFDGGGPTVLTVAVGVGLVLGSLRIRGGGDRLPVGLVACFLIWLLLFAGRATWGRLIDLLPLASMIHMHRFLGAVQIFGLLLAALGLETSARWIGRRLAGAPRTRRWVVWATPLLALVVLAIPLLQRVSFMAGNHRMAWSRTVARQREPQLAELITALRGLPPGRVFAGLHYDWGKQFQVGEVPVYGHLQAAGLDMVGFPYIGLSKPAEWQVRLDFGRLDSCDVYNVRYIVAPRAVRAPYFATLRRSFGPFVLYEVPTSGYFAMGRVEPLPADVLDAPPDSAAKWEDVYRVGLEWLRSDAPSRGRFLAFDSGAFEPSTGATGGCRVETVAPGRYTCGVEAPTDTDLILKVTYHPNWSCEVDGRPAPIVRVFPDFMAVRLLPGDHEVSFAYRAPSWKKALFLLSLAILVVGPLVVVARRRRPSGSAVP